MSDTSQTTGQDREVKLRLSGTINDVTPLVVVLKMLAQPDRDTDLRDALTRLGVTATRATDRCVTRRNQKPENTTWEIVLRVTGNA